MTLTTPSSHNWSAVPGKNLQMTYRGKPKSLFQMIDLLEKSKKPLHAIVVAQDPKVLWRDYQTLYRRVNAGGGVVENDGQILCIYRRKIWDLPKGKLDPGEKYRQAALREVMEETGLKHIRIGRKIGRTLHTFPTRGGGRILKVTRWYHMTTGHRKLVVQEEEDIEDARWITPEEFLSGDYQMFLNIRHLITRFIALRDASALSQVEPGK
jgi:8-oxo-dGTP pyrophosphatase MutT (NUDIX family)